MLVAATVAALVFDNSPLTRLYEVFLDTPVGVRVGALAIDKPLLLWINDGLMAIFFFLVGLEIKRELLRGELSTFGQAALPAIAAIGGMVVPALDLRRDQRRQRRSRSGLGHPVGHRHRLRRRRAGAAGAARADARSRCSCWRSPSSTTSAPSSSSRCSIRRTCRWLSLALAAAGIVVLAALNARGVTRLAPYLLAGLFIWVCVLKSGVHATLAGVVVAFAIPLTGKGADEPSLLEQLEESLHPWVAFGVLPLFAFANAGVSLAGLSLAKLAEPVPLGIARGPVPRQAGRHLRRDVAGGRERPGAEAGRRHLGVSSLASACWAASASP